MEVIILMSWRIWITRNNFIFKNEAFPIDGVKSLFKEFARLSIGPNQNTFQE